MRLDHGDDPPAESGDADPCPLRPLAVQGLHGLEHRPGRLPGIAELQERGMQNLDDLGQRLPREPPPVRFVVAQDVQHRLALVGVAQRRLGRGVARRRGVVPGRRSGTRGRRRDVSTGRGRDGALLGRRVGRCARHVASPIVSSDGGEVVVSVRAGRSSP